MCLRPFSLKGNSDLIPCGKCPECRSAHINGWTFRILQEFKKCDSAHFVTLTYDTHTIPITKSGRLTLDKKDLQKFIKRLRKYKRVSRSKIIYYAVGEYGTKGARPHYHLIIFNSDPSSIIKAWSYDKKQKQFNTFTNRPGTFRGGKSRNNLLYPEVPAET